jgi:lactate dehydrogenase-like 2-hydroxyacid dehydrogenase
MNIAILDASTLGDVNLDVIRELGTLTVYPLTSPEERLSRLKSIDVVITNKVIIDKELMDQCPDLKLICVSATGMNNIDLIHAGKLGISVKNVAAYSTSSVAQHTFSLIFSLLNHISYFDHFVKSGLYSKGTIFTHLDKDFSQLSAMQFGIIGMGNIGKKVARIAEAFDARICYYSTTGENLQNPWPSVSLNELLTQSDVVSIHAPLNEKTQNLISHKELILMKPASILLNMGRGGIVNEGDLANALDNEVISGAAIDVYDKEPIPHDHPFLKMKHPDRIILTPHIAWASIEARDALVQGIAKNIRNSGLQ